MSGTTSATLRLAVIGCGLRGESMTGQLARLEGCAVVALADTIPEKAAWVARRHALSAPVYPSVDALLRATSFDAGLVFTTDAHHAEVVVPLLEAGKKVFCEKPLDTTLDKCRQIVAADEAAGGLTYVGFNLRHAPFYATVKRLIDEGVAGRILTIQADEFYDGGRTYFRRWNGLRRESGGLWITKASHDFDLLAWLSGARPRTVYASAAKTHYRTNPSAGKQCRACGVAATCPDRAPSQAHELVRVGEEHGGWPHDLCLYNAPSDTFDHGIAQVSFEGDLFATYTCNVVSGFTTRRLRVAGTRATLEGELGGAVVRCLTRDPSGVRDIAVQDAGGGHGGADPLMLADFLRFARGETAPACRPREAAVAVAMGLAATESGDRGQPVDVRGV